MILETVAGTSNSQQLTLINVVGDTATPGNSYINEFSAMTTAGFWSGVRFLSETLASFRRAVHQELPGSKIVATKHALNTLLRVNISDVSSPYRTFETWIHHAVVWGNGYLWIKRDSRGQPTALLNMNPDNVAPFIYNGKKYIYYKADPDLVLDDNDVLHIALLGFDGIRGYSMVQMLRYAIETAKLGEMFTKDYFERGSFMAGSIETPKPVSPEQMATLKQNLREFSSPQGRRRFQIMILQDNMKLNNSTVPNQTGQVLETRKFSDIAICQILRISPHIIYQLDSQKLANVQQMGAEVVKYSLTPWATKIEDEINRKLFTRAEQDDGYFIRLHMDSLLRGDAAAMSTMMLAEVNAGTRTVNEYRMEFGQDPIGPAGDVLRVPVNFPNAGQPASNPGGTETAPLEDEQAATIDPPPDQGDDAVTGVPATGSGNPEPGPASFALLKPIIDAAVARVESKTVKAFASREDKPQDELTRWGNVFSSEQAAYVRDAFSPIAATAWAMQGKQGTALDVEKIAGRYELEIKRQAAGQPARTLTEILTEVGHGQ